MRRIPRILSFFFLIYLTGSGVSLFAASPSKLVEEGNRLYRKGKYDQAIQRYEEAAVDLPESPEIYFNKGNAYLAQGDLEKARALLRQAARKAADVELEARAKYNLGNLAFREAAKYRDNNLQKALAGLEESARLYRETLDLDPTDEDAKYNLEVVRLLMKDILDKLKKQQEQQQQEQKSRQDRKEEKNPGSPSSEGDKQKGGKEGEEEKKGKRQESRKAKKGEEKKEKKEEELSPEQVQITDAQARDILEEEKKNRAGRNLPRTGGERPVDKDW